jgi:hypothetical protein
MLLPVSGCFYVVSSLFFIAGDAPAGIALKPMSEVPDNVEVPHLDQEPNYAAIFPDDPHGEIAGVQPESPPEEGQ